MAYQITSESYGRRLPKITATADSTDDLATLGTDWSEGSVCTIGDTTYKLDKVKGWVDPSSGGGSGSGILIVRGSETSPKGGSGSKKGEDPKAPTVPLYCIFSSYAEIHAALEAGIPVFVYWEQADVASLSDIIHMGMVTQADIEEDEGTWYRVSVAVLSSTSVTQNYYSATEDGYLSQDGEFA